MSDVNPFFTYQPTAMSYGLGDFANATYSHKSGVVIKNKLSDRLTNRELSLTYRLIDYQLYYFYKHYNDNLGTSGEFNLPNGFAGLFKDWCGTALNDDKTQRQVFSRSTKWRYAQPIQVRTFTRGFSEITVLLIDGSERTAEMPLTPV
jgi:hypothetical protein